MSQQGPLLIVSSSTRPSLSAALAVAQILPSVETSWADAISTMAKVQPAAVVAVVEDADANEVAALSRHVGARKPYVPLIAITPGGTALPDHAIPLHGSDNHERLLARLRAALRVRTLHAMVLRRLDEKRAPDATLPDTDPLDDATVLLLGRGTSLPGLSVALGERMAVVGALSIEAAAKHLSNRDIDGIVLGEGFSPRVVDAFLAVLAEDTRFRNLAVVVTANQPAPLQELANLEIIAGAPAHIAAHALPLIRQHAFETRLNRTLRAIEAGGMLDPQTGLLTRNAFARDFATAVSQTQRSGGSLAVARFAFDPVNPRAQYDGARIISRLMRRMDFGTHEDNGSVVVVFAETDLRSAHAIARRLSSVMRHTSHGKRDTRSEPSITVAALQPGDTARTLLARVYGEAQRAAS
ncbi:GGDEF domain-containing protein [Bradyrhizobium aeschynomenes]|uniref:GGDEF domain-containing protein n=1 Tax=Bradyrhizobium aeschynomenes TaxID=2734909 RepID=UPI001555C6E1|nr:GGDEF domain-containing protein [Bradyrhizobium aeschynomenes]NPV21100.1 GGDEF domain-containing protein [Bradyrhizobium aeschynomenes]